MLTTNTPYNFFEVENWKPAQTDKIHRANRTSDSKTVCSIVKNNPKYYPPMKIGVGWRHLDRLWRHRNFRNIEKIKIVISSICTPLWKPILISKCAQKNFLQPTRKKMITYESPAYAKFKKPLKTVIGTFLKPHFSKNEIFGQKYIYCQNFRLVAPLGVE